MGSPPGRQAERYLCNFPLERILLQWGLEHEIPPKELKALQQIEQVKQAQPPSPAPKARRPEDGLWECLYEQYGSPELRREFLPYQYFSRLPLLSPEQKLSLLIQDMQEMIKRPSRSPVLTSEQSCMQTGSGTWRCHQAMRLLRKCHAT